MATPTLKDSGSISYINIQDVRAFTSAENAKNDFRFFRYTQNFPSDEDYGNPTGQPGAGNTRISGIQLQTLAKCLVDFYGYDLTEVAFDGDLADSDSIENKEYKSTSALSKTVGELQNGRGKISESKNLKIQIIKRYNPKFAAKKTNQELGSSKIELEDVAGEQIGVVGPVTYNFIIRQAIYKWFENTYLNNADSYLNKSLPKLNDSWSTKQIPQDLGYYLYVSSYGNANQQPYPTIGVLLDDTSGISNDDAILKARSYIDFLLFRDTSSLAKNNIYKVVRSKTDKESAPTRICVFADLAEVLYCPMTTPNLAIIDMIRAGISYLHTYKKEFVASQQNNDTVQSIKDSIPVPSDKFLSLSDKIDKTAFRFKEPDSLQTDAEFFSLTNAQTQDYKEQYDLITQDLLSSHFNHTNEISDRINTERTLRKNILLRNYPSSPINERVQFYYDSNFNILAASFIKNPVASVQQQQPEDETKCITKKNNFNLTIVEITEIESLLDKLTGENESSKCIKLNEKTVLFITEFFIKEFYRDYQKIKAAVESGLTSDKDKKKIPNSDEIFLTDDFSKVKVDYLYSYDKNTLLQNAIDNKATLQFVKLKSSNFWTNNYELIASLSEGTFDNFLTFHYPELIHNPSEEKKEPDPEKPSAKEPEAEPIPFERLKLPTGKGILSIPNDVDLSTKLEIKDLLSEDCFVALAKQIGNGRAADALKTLYSVLRYLDLEYLISLALNNALAELEKLAQGTGDKDTKDSILKSIDQVKQCIPPAQPPAKVLTDPEENFSDIAKRLFLFGLLNVPKIPYLFTADFLQQLKKNITNIIIQIIIEFVTQLINSIIEEIKKKLCAPLNLTADVSSNKSVNPNASKKLNPPNVGSPAGDDLTDLTNKCSYEELLSTNPNISKNQIYGVARDIYNTSITNAEFDSYFAGLSSILETQQIIDSLSNNIDNSLYAVIKKYSEPFEKFNQILFNKGTTSAFFSFLSRYVDLTPCYEQLLLDNRFPNYCFDDTDPSLALTDQEILDQANDLLNQITGLCNVVSNDSLSERLKNISYLDEQAKNAISAGANSIISTANNNFSLLKQSYDQSFETINLLNDYINAHNGAVLNVLLDSSKFQTTTNDVIIKLLVEIKNGKLQFTETGKIYNNSKINVGIQETLILTNTYSKNSVSNSDAIGGLIIEDKSKIFSFGDIINEEGKKIIASSTKTFRILNGGKFLKLPKNKEYFMQIFFDNTRFLQNIPEQQAKQTKNYYYVYNNLLNNSEKNVDKKVENIKKYKELEQALEIFLTDTKV